MKSGDKSGKSENRQETEDTLFNRQRNYQSVFNPESPITTEVLKDLAKFCRAHESTFMPDPRDHARYEGRREVFLRIAELLELNNQKLWELYTGTKF